MPRATLSVKDLRFQAGRGADRRTIIAVDRLELASGGLATISGASGSGKSTLLYLLSGLLSPGAGSILWDGSDHARLTEAARDRWRRRNAGFVFQGFHLIEELSPLENVLAPVWFGSFRAGDRRDRAQALLDRLGVPTGRKTAAVLSRGEQQRVALARALIFDPAVIFADEPTASLDAAAGAEVARLLADLARTEDRLVIVASHDDRLHALADHRLQVAQGALERLS